MTTLVLGVEIRADGFQLLRLEGFDLDPPPALRRADQRRLHQLEHRALAEGVGHDLHPPPLLPKQPLEHTLRPQRLRNAKLEALLARTALAGGDSGPGSAAGP